jgi:hypothetical protein
MANNLIQATFLALALWCPANGWTAEMLRVSPRAGSEAAGLNVSHSALPGNVFDFRTCEAVLDGNRDFGLFRVKLAPPHVTAQSAWSTNGGSYRYEWTYPEGITVRFEATPRAELVELTYTVVNHTAAALERTHLHTCVTTTEAPAFFPQLTTGRDSQLPSDTRDQDYTELLTRLFVWSGGQPLRLDRTEHARRQVHLSLLPKGGSPIEWAWWINSTNTFDEPLIAAASHDGQWTAGFWFERAAWASANTGDNRACFHLFPLFGRIERGASATVRGVFLLMRGSPETLRVRAQQRAEPGQQGHSADGQRQQDRK